MLFDSDGNATGRIDQSSQQSYTYLDPFGACYNRTITTDSGVLSAVDDGASCPDDVNTLTLVRCVLQRGLVDFRRDRADPALISGAEPSLSAAPERCVGRRGVE